MDIKDVKFEKMWEFPLPKNDYKSYDTGELNLLVNQQAFYDQYFLSGHQIFNPIYYPDIEIEVEKDVTNQDGSITKKIVKETHLVNRIGFPFQKQCITIILAHFLGNKITFEDVTIGNKNPDVLALYKNIWDTKNMNTILYKFLHANLSLGDSSIVFYKKPNDNNKVSALVYSLFTDDKITVSRDKYGNVTTLYRKYSILDENGKKKIQYDEITKGKWITYDSDFKRISTPIEENTGYNFFNCVYHRRKEGAFWTPAQNLIDNIELMVSRLSEDNRTKTIPKYFIKAEEPDEIDAEKIGSSDVLIGGKDDDMKLLSGSEISTSFSYEYDLMLDNIYHQLGIVYPKHKSSGDMPTGSMKMMFYPTERVVTELINEFNSVLDDINTCFKNAISLEYPDKGFDKIDIRASFKLFTPQDDKDHDSNVRNNFSAGLTSKSTAVESISTNSNDEINKIKEESELNNTIQTEGGTI